MAGQHNPHCMIVAAGLVWRIRDVDGQLLGLECPNGCCRTMVDMSAVDFERYCAEAVMLDYANASGAMSSARN